MWSALVSPKYPGSWSLTAREKNNTPTLGTPRFWKNHLKKYCEATHAASVLVGHLGKGRVQTLVGGRIFMVCLCVQFCSLRRTPLGLSMKTIEPVNLFARSPGKTH